MQVVKLTNRTLLQFDSYAGGKEFFSGGRVLFYMHEVIDE